MTVFDLHTNRRTWCGFVVVMAVVAAVMYGATPEFLQDTDDGDYFAEAEIAAQDLSHLFSPDRRPSAMGRPVIDVVFLVDYVLWKTNLTLYHYQVVVAHLLASLMLAFTFHRLGAPLEVGFLGALLFLCNVAHFRAVHWIASIGYPLSLIFSLSTLLAYLKALQTNRAIWFVGAATGLAAAILTHPASASVFLFCGYVAWHQIKQITKVMWPLVGAAFFCVALSYFLYPGAAQTEAVDAPFDLVRMAQTFAWYLSRLFTAPHWVLVQFRDAPLNWELAVGILGYGVLFWVWWQNKQPGALFVVWIMVALLPFYNAGPGFRWTPAEPSRHLYFPSVGSSLLFATFVFGVAHWLAFIFGKVFARFFAVAAVVVLVGLSIYNDWRVQSISFYASGRGYVARGDIDIDIFQFQRGIRRDAMMVSPDVYYRLSQMVLSRNQSPLEWIEIGLQNHPGNTNLLFLQGFWDAQQGQDTVRVNRGLQLMKTAFDKAEDPKELRYNASIAYHNRGVYFSNQKAYEKAIPFFEKALTFQENYYSAVFRLGQICWHLNRYTESVRAFQRAIEINPDETLSYLNIAKIFLQTQRYDSVAEMARLVIGFAPEEADAYNLLGIAQQAQGHFEQAASSFLKAIQLNPEHLMAHLGLATLHEADQPDVARQHYLFVLKRDLDNKAAREGLARLEH